MSFGWGSTQRPLVVASRGDHAAGHHEVRASQRRVVATAGFQHSSGLAHSSAGCMLAHPWRGMSMHSITMVERASSRVINGATPTDYDVVVVGSGIAGLSAALTAAPHARVAVVTKGALDDGCSRYAQGGIAAAVGDGDSPELHYEDTMAAGRGLCRPDAVRVLVEEGPARIRQLIDWGVAFDTQDGELLLAQEAAHSRPRILHARGDGTGLEVETALIRRMRASGARVIEHADVTGILTTADGVAMRCVDHNEPLANRTRRRCRRPRSCLRAVVRAASGATARTPNPPQVMVSPSATQPARMSRAWSSRSSIPPRSRWKARRGSSSARRCAAKAPGSSTAMASASCSTSIRAASSPVATSWPGPSGKSCSAAASAASTWTALRSAHAPRCAFQPSQRRAPGTDSTSTSDPIPVSPAAHYMVGGVTTDLDGATTVPGLYACGEVAHTGVHGANRLASNSLLEVARLLAARDARGTRLGVGIACRSAGAAPAAARAGSCRNSILVTAGTPCATRSGPVRAWFVTSPVCVRRLASASRSPQRQREPPRCRRCSCMRLHPPRRWCALRPWLARRAVAATSVLISPKQAINGMAISSCTRTEEHALTVTFRPITEALSSESIDLLIESALAEDVGAGDVTTQAVIPVDMTCRGKIVCKQDGVIAGLSIAQRVFQRVDERIQFDAEDQGRGEGPGRPDRCAALRAGSRHDDGGACRTSTSCSTSAASRR